MRELMQVKTASHPRLHIFHHQSNALGRTPHTEYTNRADGIRRMTLIDLSISMAHRSPIHSALLVRVAIRSAALGVPNCLSIRRPNIVGRLCPNMRGCPGTACCVNSPTWKSIAFA
ncbi:hypothetical protein EJ06DRAFT_177796 [Trichodelitschia bisporula]|uniref:Uncharacterized protein n=1 Tax=Trichodelitschia bisporula TaxID=703511 RepID=A0A6G1HM19_9PEZI|nr:hypothetical protein EJ06DRAFT_177796 [Trichodelitschia bisporula]